MISELGELISGDVLTAILAVWSVLGVVVWGAICEYDPDGKWSLGQSGFVILLIGPMGWIFILFWLINKIWVSGLYRPCKGFWEWLGKIETLEDVDDIF